MKLTFGIVINIRRANPIMTIMCLITIHAPMSLITFHIMFWGIETSKGRIFTKVNNSPKLTTIINWINVVFLSYTYLLVVLCFSPLYIYNSEAVI